MKQLPLRDIIDNHINEFAASNAQASYKIVVTKLFEHGIGIGHLVSIRDPGTDDCVRYYISISNYYYLYDVTKNGKRVFYDVEIHITFPQLESSRYWKNT